jgi:hypothetical protein
MGFRVQSGRRPESGWETGLKQGLSVFRIVPFHGQRVLFF